MADVYGRIVNLKRFAVHDGDGLRTTLFVKGCPLHCKWCHNPESIAAESELGYYAHKCIGCGRCVEVCPVGAHAVTNGVHTFDRAACRACGKCASVCLAEALLFYGERVTPNEILPKLLADADFYKNSGGGVTISGGEPLLQAAFCAEVLRLLQEKGIHTAVDTCLFGTRAQLEALLPYTDIFLVDVKAFDAEVHKALTGQPNEIILENIRYLDRLCKPMEIRIPYVPNQNAGEIEKIAEFLAPLHACKGVRVLPYHNLSSRKYDSIDMPYTLSAEDAPLPTGEEIEHAKDILRAKGLTVLE